MGFFSSRSESSTDKALRIHSETVREERRAAINDQRLTQGLNPQHCGVEASLVDGDFICGRCGQDC